MYLQNNPNFPNNNGSPNLPSSPEETNGEEDWRVKRMADMVLEETVVTDGNRTEEWNLRAARCVFRYVRKNGVFDTFFDVLTRGETSSKCCAGINEKLPGSHGRLCIFILRLFRFPWIRHDIQAKSTLNCRHQTDRKTVCLNPWHYRQVEIPHVPCPPIVINKNLDYGKPPERSENPLDEELTHHEMQVDQMTDEEREKRIPNVTMMGDELKMAYERHLYNPDDFNAMHALFTPPYTFNMNNIWQISHSVANGGASTSATNDWPRFVAAQHAQMSSNEAGTSSSSSLPNSDEEIYYRSGLSSPASGSSDIASSPHVFRPAPVADAPAIPIRQAMDQVMGDIETEDVEEDVRRGAERMEMDSERRKDRPRYPDGRPITPIEPCPLFRSSPAELAALIRPATYECVEYEEREKWLALVYYEESQQIGEVKDFDRHHCLVDGYTSASMEKSPTRFSIGYYNNPRRSHSTSEVRSLIGKGVRLYLLAGEVYIENLSSIAVFVQSISANMKNSFELNTVSKLPPVSTMKVFDMRQFSKQLSVAATKTYQDVYSLSRMCTVRVSFVKGWGQNYRRSTVLRSPVWFQAHLYNPMAWIDSVLTCMGAPPRLCSSRS